MTSVARPAGDIVPNGPGPDDHPPAPPSDLNALVPAIWPRSARRRDGAIALGGLDVRDLAARFGTPLFACDEADFRGRCRDFRAAFGPATRSATRRRRSAAARCCAGRPRRGWAWTSAPTASWRPRCRPGCRARSSPCTATTRPWPSWPAPWTRAWAASCWTPTRRSPGSPTWPSAAARGPGCWSGSPPAWTPARTRSSPPRTTTRSSASRSPRARPPKPFAGYSAARIWSSLGCTRTSARRSPTPRSSWRRLG